MYTHTHAHSQNVSWYHDYNYRKPWLGCTLSEKLQGPGCACRAEFQYVKCTVAGFSGVNQATSDEEVTAFWLVQHAEGNSKGRSQSLLIQEEAVPYMLPYKWLQMRTVWKSKVETRAFPSFFMYCIPCVVILPFLNPISIRHLFLIYFWSETIYLNIWNIHKYFSLELTASCYIDSVVFFLWITN